MKIKLPAKQIGHICVWILRG